MKSLSVTVLEAMMTECLMKMESSTDSSYIDKQIALFKQVENEIRRRKNNVIYS